MNEAGAGENRRRLFRSCRLARRQWLQDGQSLSYCRCGIGLDAVPGQAALGQCMKPSALIGLVCGLSLLAATAASHAGVQDGAPGAWAERVQVIYLSQSHSVVR